MTAPFTLYIQTNSPGELISWVQPLAKSFKQAVSRGRVVLCLVPCQYASGEEKRIASKIISIDEVWTPHETVHFLLTLPFRKKQTRGAIMFCGGDPLYAQALGLKMGLPVYGYTEHKRLIAPLFKKIFYRHQVGDLMGDRILQFEGQRHSIIEQNQLENRDYCLFFAGSRPKQFEILVGIWGSVLNAIQAQNPDFKAILQISPFIPDSLLQDVSKRYDLSGFVIRRGNSLDLMSVSNLLVTIPGTNMAEASYMGLPMMMVLPLNRPDLLIMQGLAGLLINIPGVGRLLQNLIISILKKRHRFYGLPNMMRNEEIVPEIIDEVRPNEMAQYILTLYYDQKALNIMKSKLASFRPKKLISEEIIQEIIKD
jgi:lipid A disaccharide synthetase